MKILGTDHADNTQGIRVEIEHVEGETMRSRTQFGILFPSGKIKWDKLDDPRPTRNTSVYLHHVAEAMEQNLPGAILRDYYVILDALATQSYIDPERYRDEVQLVKRTIFVGVGEVENI